MTLEQIDQTSVWQSTFGDDWAGPAKAFVDRLRQAFIRFRDNTTQLARHLPQDLRQLTIHDETHTDALWQIFDLVFPSQLIANPLEAFVLGGAFLIHDLGHAVCMYPGGIDQLKATDAWRRASKLLAARGSDPQAITELAIRWNHAAHAQTLASSAFADGIYLLDDFEIRTYLGRVIGNVAYSHWWDHQRLRTSEDLNTIGAVPLSDCPPSWSIDQRKLAYVIRVCDACHIDGRRAPILAQSLRKPTGVSSAHWAAQRHLAQPQQVNGEVRFTSFEPFPLDKIDAWWTAYDLAQTAEQELREADAYFSGQSLRPLATRVAGASSPRAFARYVQVRGWEPVDTQPIISSIPQVIKRLGGEELYGADVLVPLRELIQNARDAVVARRIIENRAETWGEIKIKIESTDERDVLEVSDNGIGLSEHTILNYLLDFGLSYWQSGDCIDDHPNLDFEKFTPVGFYGIGFFSIFMLGEKVKLVTRRRVDGPNDTRILEFSRGLDARPILRLSTTEEQLLDPGTTIRVELADKSILRRILTPKHERIQPLMTDTRFRDRWTLNEAVAWLCPASDVDIVVNEAGVENPSVSANDWTFISPDSLFRRLFLHRSDIDEVLQTPRSIYHLNSLESLRDGDRVIGRASLFDNLTHIYDSNGLYGVLVCGPFRSGVQPLFPGILLGKTTTASRTGIKPFALEAPGVIGPWATRQARHAIDGRYGANIVNLAAQLRTLNGDIFDLPVYLHDNAEVSLRRIIQTQLPFAEVRLYPEMRFAGMSTEYDPANPSHIGVTMGRGMVGKFLQLDDPQERSLHRFWRQYWHSLWGAALEAVSIAWRCDLTVLIENATDINDGQGFTLTPAVLHRPR